MFAHQIPSKMSLFNNIGHLKCVFVDLGMNVVMRWDRAVVMSLFQHLALVLNAHLIPLKAVKHVEMQ